MTPTSADAPGWLDDRAGAAGTDEFCQWWES